MNVAEILEYGRAFAGARFAGQRIPLVVSIVVTNRCNYSCAYCDRWDGRGTRMTTEQLMSMLDEMASMGTKRVIFTGGEPLVRKDIFQLIDHAKGHGFKVNLNTNGTLVPQFIDRLTSVSSFQISIDGDRQVHDHIRGEGAFDAAIAAVRAAQQIAGVKVRLSAVISKVSIGGEDALIEIAKREGVGIMFQPAELRVLSSDDNNPLAPAIPEYRETIERLIARKQQGAPIENSISTLKYLFTWPNGEALPCAGSKLFARVEHDGRVLICGRMGNYEESFPALDVGFRKAFLQLNEARCPTCWCGPRVEVNQAFALQPDAIWNLAFNSG